MRLTKKNEVFLGGYEPLAPYCDVASKLGKLEDIEEELGIDLETLFKALKRGIYGKVSDKIEHILAPHFSWHYSEIYIFKIKDYGKTWALSKDELNK